MVNINSKMVFFYFTSMFFSCFYLSLFLLLRARRKRLSYFVFAIYVIHLIPRASFELLIIYIILYYKKTCSFLGGWLGMVAHDFIPSTCEAEADSS